MLKKLNLFIVLFSLCTLSLYGMEVDESCEMRDAVEIDKDSLDIVPLEIIDQIIDKMFPQFITSEKQLYKSITNILSLLATSQRYYGFESTISEKIKKLAPKKFIKDYIDETLEYAIEKQNFRAAKILIDAGGMLPDLSSFIEDNARNPLDANYLNSLSFRAKLLKLLQENDKLNDFIITSKDNSAIEEIMANSGYPTYLLGKMPKKYLIIPLKVFLNSIQDNEKVIDAVLSSPTSKGSNALMYAIDTGEPKLVTLILKAINNYPELTKKLFDEQKVHTYNTHNVLMRAIRQGSKKIIPKLLEAGFKAKSNQLIQKDKNDKTALDLAQDQETKELIQEYLNKGL